MNEFFVCCAIDQLLLELLGALYPVLLLSLLQFRGQEYHIQLEYILKLDVGLI